MHRIIRLRGQCAACAVALLSLGVLAVAQPDIPELVAALSNDDGEIRSDAVERAAVAGPAAIIAVAALLDDPRLDVASAANDAIGRIVKSALQQDATRASALNALAIAALATKNRNPLIDHLGGAGALESLPVLVNLLDKVPDSFEHTLRALMDIGEQGRYGGNASAAAAVCAALVERLGRFEGPRRGAIMRAIGDVACDGAEEVLIDGLMARTPASEDAAAALGDIGGERAIAPLWAYAEKSRSAAALDAALRILARLPWDKAENQYANLLRNTSPHKRIVQQDPVLLVQRADTQRVLCALIEGIGRTATSAGCVELLLPYLDAEDSDLRSAARAALLSLNAEGVTDRLERRAKKGPDARQTAISEIVETRRKAGLP